MDAHSRRSIRLRGYDYALPGAYFITICTYQRKGLFGEVVRGHMNMNFLGEIASACWRAIRVHFRDVTLDAWGGDARPCARRHLDPLGRSMRKRSSTQGEGLPSECFAPITRPPSPRDSTRFVGRHHQELQVDLGALDQPVARIAGGPGVATKLL